MIIRIHVAVLVLSISSANLSAQSRPSAQSPSREEFAASIRRQVVTVSENTLANLVAAENPNIAIAAAWERVCRTIPAQRQDVPVHPPRESLERFLGFVEGRMQCSPPQFWQDAVLSTSGTNRSYISFDIPMGKYAATLPTAPIEIKAERDRLIINASGEQWIVPQSAPTGTDICGALCETDSVAYIAVYHPVPVSFFIHAINRKDGALKWTARVWSAGALRNYQGPNWHLVGLQLSGANLLVFGASATSIYLEAFDKLSGLNVLRFSDEYLEYEGK